MGAAGGGGTADTGGSAVGAAAGASAGLAFAGAAGKQEKQRPLALSGMRNNQITDTKQDLPAKALSPITRQMLTGYIQGTMKCTQ